MQKKPSFTFFDDSFLDSFLLSFIYWLFRFFLLDLVFGSHSKKTAAVFSSTVAFLLLVSWENIQTHWQFKMESIRKLSNFNFWWTKTLYQNNLNNIAFFFFIFQGLLVICNNTKDYFSQEPQKINVKFHKNCENTAKILKISCVRCHFVKFDIYFLQLS